MSFRTVKSIEKAFNLVHTKKENLRQAFEQLQSQSAQFSSFKFTWTDFDSYFTSVESELLNKFSTLQALESSRASRPVLPEPVPARPELKSLCENMDGLGLRKYVFDRPTERIAIGVELADAFKHAPNPGSMVLDALEGFWDENHEGSVSRLRTSCVVLLEELMRAGVEIATEVRERAMAVAVEWKGSIGGADDRDDEGKEEEDGLEMERLGYLQLLATYKLFDDIEHDANDLIAYVVSSARYRQSVELCRILGLDAKVPDVIQRLITKGKYLLALKFIFEYDLTDEFPPVPLLKAYEMESKKIAQKISKRRKNSRQSLNDAGVKEISALKVVIKCIEEYNLESQYPKDELVTRIEKLEKDKADRKRSIVAPVVPKSQYQVKQPKQNGNKRMRAASGAPAFKRKVPANSVFPTQRAGLLLDHAAAYLPSPAGAYGRAGSLVPTAPYVASSANLYGLPGAHVGYPGNLNPSASNPYPSETHAQPGYYEVPSQYHPALYPQ